MKMKPIIIGWIIGTVVSCCVSVALIWLFNVKDPTVSFCIGLPTGIILSLAGVVIGIMRSDAA